MLGFTGVCYRVHTLCFISSNLPNCYTCSHFIEEPERWKRLVVDTEFSWAPTSQFLRSICSLTGWARNSETLCPSSSRCAEEHTAFSGRKGTLQAGSLPVSWECFVFGPVDLRKAQKQAVYTKTDMGVDRAPPPSLQQGYPSQSPHLIWLVYHRCLLNTKGQELDLKQNHLDLWLTWSSLNCSPLPNCYFWYYDCSTLVCKMCYTIAL